MVSRMAATETSFHASHALDELYRAHAAEVFRYAYAVLGNHADAEDVTQTTFVNALRALERGEQPRAPSNWLITIAHNIVRQRFRQQRVRPAEVELDPDVTATQQPDDDGPSIQDLVKALQRIPPSQREALVMRELEGRSYKEIKGILGLTQGALETLLFRARRSLAEELDNLVTCDRAEFALSRHLDGRLSRKERRRLDAHLRECPNCERLQASQTKHRRAFKGLALVPLPLSLTLFKGAPSASAATGLSTIGTSATAVAGGVSLGTAGGTVSCLAAGGVVAKVAAVLAAAAVAGGAGYEGASQFRQHLTPKRPANVVPAAAVTHRAPKPAGEPAAKPPAHARSRPEGRRVTNAPGLTKAAQHTHQPTFRASVTARSHGTNPSSTTRVRPSVGSPARKPVRTSGKRGASPAKKPVESNRPSAKAPTVSPDGGTQTTPVNNAGGNGKSAGAARP